MTLKGHGWVGKTRPVEAWRRTSITSRIREPLILSWIKNFSCIKLLKKMQSSLPKIKSSIILCYWGSLNRMSKRNPDCPARTHFLTWEMTIYNSKLDRLGLTFWKRKNQWTSNFGLKVKILNLIFLGSSIFWLNTSKCILICSSRKQA